MHCESSCPARGELTSLAAAVAELDEISAGMLFWPASAHGQVPACLPEGRGPAPAHCKPFLPAAAAALVTSYDNSCQSLNYRPCTPQATCYELLSAAELAAVKATVQPFRPAGAPSVYQLAALPLPAHIAQWCAHTSALHNILASPQVGEQLESGTTAVTASVGVLQAEGDGAAAAVASHVAALQWQAMGLMHLKQDAWLDLLAAHALADQAAGSAPPQGHWQAVMVSWAGWHTGLCSQRAWCCLLVAKLGVYTQGLWPAGAGAPAALLSMNAAHPKLRE